LQKNTLTNTLLGAAFLMATSAIGPGFLTQTTIFTQQLQANFGFVILISILLDLVAQMNIWRIVSVTALPAQDLAEKLQKGLGITLALMIAFGGLAFNIGNIAGCGLGLKVLFGIEVKWGGLLSAGIALFIFSKKEAGKVMDFFAKILGILMIGLTTYIAFIAQAPLQEVIVKSFLPDKIDPLAIITIVGGTVGGYISFAGAHRLLEAGVTGETHLKDVTRGASTAILLASVMRIVLFLGALGMINKGFVPSTDNPPASIFQAAAGDWGYRFFGIVLWSAAITSVVGAAYTSVSFLKTLHPSIEKNTSWITVGFISFSTLIFIFIGKPVALLVAAGAINGLILPFALAILLIIVRKKRIVENYRHPLWLEISGWILVAVMGFLAVKSFF
jgi:Mn2+/Fe2+ NRAMP family transporter